MHLIVCCHGMWGKTTHLTALVEEIQKEHAGEGSVILNSSRNQMLKTYHGVDECAQRVYEDILTLVQERASNGNPISSVSFIGYSAGGLFNRYVIGLLHANQFFDTIKPLHFITIATPHLGIRKSPRSITGRIMNALTGVLIDLYAGKSGQQMLLVDKCSGPDKVPLLLRMSTIGSVWYDALSKFAHVYFYANANNDNTVPFCTSSLSITNKFRRDKLSTDTTSTVDGYKHIRSIELITTDTDICEFTPVPKKKEFGSVLRFILFVLSSIFMSGFALAHCIFLMVPMRMIGHILKKKSSIPVLLPAELDKEYQLKKKQKVSQQSPVVSETEVVVDATTTSTTMSDVKAIVTKAETSIKMMSNAEDSPTTVSTAFDADLAPWVILKNLASLPIHRVSVFIPGGHTHGMIICRHGHNDGGKEVVEHIARYVLKIRDTVVNASSGKSS